MAAPLKVSDLRVDFHPSATKASPKSTFSWKISSDERGKRQTGYEIIAASSAERLTQEKADLWKSGKVNHSQRNMIKWAGKDPGIKKTIHWKVRVWDENKEAGAWSEPATFETGLHNKLPKAARVSTFESSSESLNALYNESVGVLEDRLTKFTEGEEGALGNGAQVQRSARALLFNFDATPHLLEWIHLMDKYRVADVLYPAAMGTDVPRSHSTANSDAGISVTHPLWWMSGNNLVAKERWADFEKYLIARYEADKLYKGLQWGSGYELEGTPSRFTELAYFGLVTRFARELSRPAEQPLNVFRFQDYAARIKNSFGEQFVGEDGVMKIPSQSAGLLALRSAILSPEQQKPVITALVEDITKNGPKVGLEGANFLLPVLTLTNHHDLAVKTLINLTPQQMNAFAGNGTSEWLISMLGGIDAQLAGFASIRIAPRIPSDDSLTWVKTSYDSISGKISCHWEKQGDGLKAVIEVPAGCLAQIYLPKKKGQSVTEGGKSLKEASSVDLMSENDTTVAIAAQSGRYEFLIK